MLKTLQGFKDFIMRGNVIDLAVGIVIGAAFTGLVTAFTGSFIEPLLKIFGADQATKKAGGSFDIAGSAFQWSSFVNALISFVITAAVLYFLVVLPMNTLAERRKRGIEREGECGAERGARPAAGPSEEVRLLTEIRDALINGALPRQREAATDSLGHAEPPSRG